MEYTKPEDTQRQNYIVIDLLNEIDDKRGMSRLDELLISQLTEPDLEQIHLIYQKIDLANFARLFYPRKNSPGKKFGIYKAKTIEDSVADSLDRIEQGDLSSLGSVEDYLKERMARRYGAMENQTGIGEVEAFVLYSIALAIGLKDKYNPELATELKQVLRKNLFPDGVGFIVDNQPKRFSKRLIATIHFHIGKDFVPPSAYDLQTSNSIPGYVGAYSLESGRTKLYYAHHGEGEEIALIKNSQRVKTFPYNAEMPALSVERIKKLAYLINCSGNNDLRLVRFFGLDEKSGYQYLTSYKIPQGNKKYSVVIDLDKGLAPKNLIVFVLDENYKGNCVSFRVS